MVSASATDGAIQRKMHGRGVVREGKEITLVISNENTDDTIKIIKPLEKSDLLIDGVSETVTHEIKNHEGVFLGMLLGTLHEHSYMTTLDEAISSRSTNIRLGRD